MKFLAYINDYDGERVALLSENELIKMEDESDFTGIWFKKIFDVTDSENIKEIRYRGWQPDCLIEFVDNDDNVVLRGYGTDH